MGYFAAERRSVGDYFDRAAVSVLAGYSAVGTETEEAVTGPADCTFLLVTGKDTPDAYVVY